MARSIGVNFNGKNIVHPGAYSRVNPDAMGLGGSASNRSIVFVGSSEGGKPGTVHWFTNPTDAKKVLRGGDLMTAGELAWSPMGDEDGASLVGFLRVEDAKQGELVKDGLTLTSLDYGSHVNKIQAKLENGSLKDSKRLTVYFWTDNVYEVYDNIGPIFTLKYEGDQEHASVSVIVDESSKKAKTLVVKLGADEKTAVDALTYDLEGGQFDVVQKVIADINEHEGFKATLIPFGNKNIDSVELDEVLDASIKDGYTLKAMKGDLIHQTKYSRIFTANFDGEFPENFEYVYFTGGSNGTVPASWTDHFNLLYGEGVDMLVPLTAQESIHAECARFVDFQSSEERAEMLGLYGGALGESIDMVISRALTLNSSRSVVAYPGITKKFANNKTLTLPAYFTAALIAGKIAGVPIGEPITLDYVSLIGLEYVPNAAEVNRLIESGVTTLEFVRYRNRKGFRIAQGITTYQADANPVYREISTRLVTDSLNRDLRERLERKFAGGKGTRLTAALVKNEVQSFLDDKVREEWIVDYKRNVEVSLTGDVIHVNYEAQPVNAVNYILITTTFYQEIIQA